MLEVKLLGSGGMIPLPDRYLSALMVRYNGTSIIIDCGEGTQVAIRASGLGFKQIGLICLTHFHADHIAGLPGLLLTIGNSGRTEPLVIAGPKHVGHVADCLRVIAPQLPYPVEYAEITGNGEVLSLGPLTVSAHTVEHWTACYAYRLDIERKGKFNADKAKELGIPVGYWSVLQAGNTVGLDGRSFKPSDVLGNPRRGLRLCYATDMRPSDSLAEFARDADLFVCEGMYGDPELLEKAKEHRHCMFSEAAGMAKKANARELWLTHFSPSMPRPEEYLRFASEIFENVFIGKTSAILRFNESE